MLEIEELLHSFFRWMCVKINNTSLRIRNVFYHVTHIEINNMSLNFDKVFLLVMNVEINDVFHRITNVYFQVTSVVINSDLSIACLLEALALLAALFFEPRTYK